MKKIIYVVFAISLLFSSCTNDAENTSVTLKFTHYWDDTKMTNQDLNQLRFTNANGEKLSIERLRYAISNISLIGGKNYHLVDFGENFGTALTISDLTDGTYNISFRFGFSDEDNTDGIYKNLNSLNFDVPGMLGGGYHYMQFDGKFLDDSNQEIGFNYHTIRAVDRTDPNNLVFQDTSFKVDLGTVVIINNAEIEVRMNVAEWFKNPNTWNLNELNTVLMPNFEVQKMMSANGKSVFSLGEVNQ
ncbi:MbnP family protein [uncultured Polaribacter sp.]|uniref:MbnP family protein n=1 Tax=uncultured Polaribacter sp. TaxID=174711 RepID=UPI002623E0C0|nr:MbnP family protein [uncultured Polaribacter sp.]